MRYKGTYRLRTPMDEKTHNFPREYNGQFAENDIYIDCQKGKIFHYGKAILQFYTNSLGRGRNIVKAINNDLGENIIHNIEESDSEVLFRFHSKYMEQLEPYLKPKTNGASISPFSTKNLLKTKYVIPDEDLVVYKELVQKLGQNRIIELTHKTNDYIKSIATKKNPLDRIKADMALKGLSGKNYIHSIGKWEEYIKYLEDNL